MRFWNKSFNTAGELVHYIFARSIALDEMPKIYYYSNLIEEVDTKPKKKLEGQT